MGQGQEDVGAFRLGPPIDELTRSRVEVPNLPSTVVERGRLVELIDRGARGPLTLVSAPAGTGKTVAVATWVASGHVPGPIVWITLGEDADAAQLWTLLAEALHRNGVFDRGTLPQPSAGSADDFLSALTAGLAARREPVVLVLDCPIDLPPDSATDLHELLTATYGRLRLIT
ncbi:MAG TPA: hypothetical protein VKB75_05135, partial [Jatrophihabitans sp.]|nr:hypothetical protein [Jatrophihabitans sp.]